MKNTAIVLVSPKGDANIGAVARAMKNFGITKLILIDPVDYKTKDGYGWAVDAKDILDNASIHSSLKEALEEFSISVAFTRRLGRTRKNHLTIENLPESIQDHSLSGKIALVFGTEDAGLNNNEVDLCDMIVSIPTMDSLPSLNLSQAVIIACYEIYKFSQRAKPNMNKTWKYASKKQTKKIITLLAQTLDSLDYQNKPDNEVKDKIINQFNKLFGRAGLLDKDIRMFEGLLSRIASKTKK